MPKQKDLKRVVRTRMQKTGESYTTARLHVLNAKPKPAPIAKPKPKAPKIDYAALAGITDEAVKKATGCNWERWVGALDYVGAAEWPHREIAKFVSEKYKIPGWWAQSVTVGYERIRGLREKGQRRGGGFETNKSKTIAVPLAKLYEAFRNARLRKRWLPVKVTVSSATPEKYMHLKLDDDTRVAVGFYAKGEGKSQVAIQHAKLVSKSDADRMKAFWAERLDALAEVVTAK